MILPQESLLSNFKKLYLDTAQEMNTAKLTCGIVSRFKMVSPKNTKNIFTNYNLNGLLFEKNIFRLLIFPTSVVNNCFMD